MQETQTCLIIILVKQHTMRVKCIPSRHIPKCSRFCHLKTLIKDTSIRYGASAMELRAAHLLSMACDEHLVDLFAQSTIGAMSCAGAVKPLNPIITVRDLRLAQRLINR
jgi:hypothetical protein